jgi:quinol monooxygenase YgiN
MPIIAIGDIYAQIPRLEELRRLMRETQELIREQPGCISYAFVETLDDPGHFLHVARWRDREALEEHYRSDAFADYQANVEALLVRSSALDVYAAAEGFRPVASVGENPQLDE